MFCLFVVAVGAIPNNPVSFGFITHGIENRLSFYLFDRNDENYFVQWALLSFSKL